MNDTYPQTHVQEELTVVDTGEFESDELSLEDQLSALPEQLQDRVETAVNNCELERSVEIEDAIASYYADHYKTALIVDRIIEGQPVDGSLLSNEETMLESFELTQALEMIIGEGERHKQLDRLNNFVSQKLFAEAAVGQTTITDQEIRLALGLNQKLQDTAKSENIHIRYPASDARVLEVIGSKTKLFWEDSRAAGQLEFHNTPFANQAAIEGFKLRSKPNQTKEKGGYNSVTADVSGHSQTVHFSETFLSDSYKSIQMGNMVDHITVGGTIAVPLAEIVEQLPYARGGEYGIATPKSDAKNGPTIIENANIYAFKGSHVAGRPDDEPTKNGDDRTFYADRFSRRKGEDYAIDFGRAMKSPTGNVSHVIFLQRDIDIAHREQYMRNAGNVDGMINFGMGEGYPAVDVLDYDYGAPSFLERGVAMEKGKMFIDKEYHAHSANGLGLVDPHLERVATEHQSYREGVTPEQQEQELRVAIQQMQQQSRELPRYKDKLVVMLRGGTMAYRPSA